MFYHQIAAGSRRTSADAGQTARPGDVAELRLRQVQDDTGVPGLHQPLKAGTELLCRHMIEGTGQAHPRHIRPDLRRRPPQPGRIVAVHPVLTP